MKKALLNTISSFEAKTHFSQLMGRVQNGERITILKHNNPIAVIIPFDNTEASGADKAINDMILFSKENKLKGLKIKSLIEEGRK
jgi:prevent-host-death family protein